MMLPKGGIAPTTNGKPRSEMSNKRLEATRVSLNGHECWHCGTTRNLQMHEIFHGTGKRRLSLIYQMVVCECKDCHFKIHNGDLDDMELKEYGQEYFERMYPNKNFLEVFSINYLDKE